MWTPVRISARAGCGRDWGKSSSLGNPGLPSLKVPDHRLSSIQGNLDSRAQPSSVALQSPLSSLLYSSLLVSEDETGSDLVLSCGGWRPTFHHTTHKTTEGDFLAIDTGSQTGSLLTKALPNLGGWFQRRPKGQCWTGPICPMPTGKSTCLYR